MRLTDGRKRQKCPKTRQVKSNISPGPGRIAHGSHGRMGIGIVSDPGGSDAIAVVSDAIGHGNESDEDEPQKENGSERTHE